MRKITFREAINEAIAQEMERDQRVFVYGLDVADHKRIFGTTQGLVERFGRERCFGTPLSEDAMTGFGIGAAINGLRPIHVHTRVDFLLLAVNQIINMLSCYSYMTAGRSKVPMVIRAIIGRGWGQSFQHSKSLYSIFAHIPGLKVVAPSSPKDAKGLLIAAIRDEGPVIFFEHRWLYDVSGDVPEDAYMIPLGESAILRQGNDITIVAASWMTVEAMQASDMLVARGVSVEVIDSRTIAPLNTAPIIESVRKTGRCIIADNDWVRCGFSAEIAARIAEECPEKLKSPVTRIGFAQTHCPTSKPLEDLFYPNAGDIIRAAERSLGLEPMELKKEEFYNWKKRFKGPF